MICHDDMDQKTNFHSQILMGDPKQIDVGNGGNGGVVFMVRKKTGGFAGI